MRVYVRIYIWIYIELGRKRMRDRVIEREEIINDVFNFGSINISEVDVIIYYFDIFNCYIIFF